MLDNINNELYKIKEYIENKKYTKAIFECDKIKVEVIKKFLESKDIILENDNNLIREFKKNFSGNEDVINIYYAINDILIKYDYDHQDVFDKADAEKMFFYIIKLIELYNTYIEKEG